MVIDIVLAPKRGSIFFDRVLYVQSFNSRRIATRYPPASFDRVYDSHGVVPATFMRSSSAFRRRAGSPAYQLPVAKNL